MVSFFKRKFNLNKEQIIQKMETVIEQQRRYHEERERLEDAMTQEILLKKSNQKEQVNSDHRTRTLLERYVEVSGSALKMY